MQKALIRLSDFNDSGFYFQEAAVWERNIFTIERNLRSQLDFSAPVLEVEPTFCSGLYFYYGDWEKASKVAAFIALNAIEEGTQTLATTALLDEMIETLIQQFIQFAAQEDKTNYMCILDKNKVSVYALSTTLRRKSYEIILLDSQVGITPNSNIRILHNEMGRQETILRYAKIYQASENHKFPLLF